MDNSRSLSHSKWDCKYHIVWIPKYRRKVLYGPIRKHLGEVLRGLARRKESEVLELKIRREGRRQREEAETILSVTLKLDNVDYGTIRAVVTLIGKKVSTTFWCEQTETQQLFAQRMEELRQRINEQGLEIGRTQAFTGVPPEPDGPNIVRNSPRPIDRFRSLTTSVSPS